MRLTCGNVWAAVDATPDEHGFLRDYLSVKRKGAEHSQAFQNGVWDGRERLYREKEARFPSGLVRPVAGAAKRAGLEVAVDDVRAPLAAAWSEARLGWLRDYQLDAARALLRRTRGIVQMPTGCLAGDTIVEVNRGGKSYRTTIAKLAGPRGGRWREDIVTTIRCRTEDGFIRLRKVRRTYPSGRKITYAVRTLSGKVLRATLDHRFLTEDGWRPLGAIAAGMRVYVEAPFTGAMRGVRKVWYRITNGLKRHPYAGRRGVDPRKGGWSVPHHRLVAEAKLNGIFLDQFLAAVRAGRLDGLIFLDPKVYAVHHVDGDVRNNEPENLAILPHEEHGRSHGVESGWRHVTASTALDEIVSIVRHGEEETFDIEMDGEPRNFLANGIVVHNSGKTSVFIAWALGFEVPWLVLVDTRDLLEQAAERFERYSGGEVAGRWGDGRRDARRFTVATLQSVHSGLRKGDPEVAGLLGRARGLVVDEVHVLPADTYFAVAMACENAYLRAGTTATAGMRGDERDYMAVGATGPIIHNVLPGPLIERGILARPKIVFVENPCPKVTGSYDEVYEALVMLSDERNELVVEMALAAPRPTLVFVRREKHGHELARRLQAAGLRAEFVWGASSTAARAAAAERLQRGNIDALVTSKIFNKGVDLPLIGGGVNAAGGASGIDALQRLGRFMRATKGKKGFVYYDVLDRNDRWLRRHASARMDAYREDGYEVEEITRAELAARRAA